MARENDPDANDRQWRVLVVGTGEHALALINATLRTIDPSIVIDHVEDGTEAERTLLSSTHYDAGLILDHADAAATETPAAMVQHLSVGPRPPLLISISVDQHVDAVARFDGLIPVSLDIDDVTPRRLLEEWRTARELHQLRRLDHLIAEATDRLDAGLDGRIAGLESLLEDLVDAIDVSEAHLSLASRTGDLRWELSSAGVDGLSDHSGIHHAATLPGWLTLDRSSPSFKARLRTGPVAPRSHLRLTAPLTTFLDLILATIQRASDQRVTQRAGIMSHLFTGHAPQPTPGDARRTVLIDALPELGSELIDALLQQDLILLHQPIMGPDGEIGESDAQLGLPRYDDDGLHPILDLSALDRLDTDLEPLVTSELTVPTGHWLIASALPTLHRLLADGDLEPGHRVHLALLHRQLADRGTSDLIIDLLGSHGVDAASLAIDVAEPTLLEHHDTISAMSHLAEHGVSLYLDGFGGAGSNFALLRTPLVRGVKLSKQVIRGVSVDDRQASIVSGLIALCDELGLEVIATGVDHRADYDWLTTFGHVSLQGALIGQSLAEEQLLGQRAA